MKKVFFSSLLVLFFLILIYLSFNSNLRRSILNLSVGLINNYYSISVGKKLRSNEGIIKSIKKIEEQIKLTDFITTNQKNSFIDNIYLNIYNVEEFINSDKDLIYLSKVVEELIKKDPNIYDALVWQAKIMSYKDSGKDKIYTYVNSAIKLSPASIPAYRFAFDFSKKVKDEKKFKKFCKDYHEAFLGNRIKKDNESLFSGSSLTRFAIQINSNENYERYIMEGISLNKDQDYIFDFRKPINFSEFKTLSNFLPGTLINFLKIELKDINNNNIQIPVSNIYISSNNSFFINENNMKKILVSSLNDEKIIINFQRVFKDIIQLKLKINFSKANLTNEPGC